MTTVKPEHVTNAAFLAMLLVRPTDGNGNVPESRAVEVIAALIQERDTARADARVLAAEVRKWREGMESETFNRFGYAEYEATDASGALERNRSKQ